MKNITKATIISAALIFSNLATTWGVEGEFSSYSECAANNPNSAQVCETIFIKSSPDSNSNISRGSDGKVSSGGGTVRKTQEIESAEKQKPKSTNGKRATTPVVLMSTPPKIPLASFTA